MKYRGTNNRSAFTLVELSISMSAGSALMILAIGLVHQTMSLSSTGRQRSDHQRTLARLAVEFRHDVHRAAECNVESPGNIELVLAGDNLVTYEARGNRITRRQPLDDGRTRREVFTFSVQSTATFESIDQSTRAAVTIVHNSHLSNEHPRVDRKIIAVVGRLTTHQTGEVLP
jgi:hypothetical protein